MSFKSSPTFDLSLIYQKYNFWKKLAFSICFNFFFDSRQIIFEHMINVLNDVWYNTHRYMEIIRNSLKPNQALTKRIKVI